MAEGRVVKVVKTTRIKRGGKTVKTRTTTTRYDKSGRVSSRSTRTGEPTKTPAVPTIAGSKVTSTYVQNGKTYYKTWQIYQQKN